MSDYYISNFYLIDHEDSALSVRSIKKGTDDYKLDSILFERKNLTSNKKVLPLLKYDELTNELGVFKDKSEIELVVRHSSYDMMLSKLLLYRGCTTYYSYDLDYNMDCERFTYSRSDGVLSLGRNFGYEPVIHLILNKIMFTPNDELTSKRDFYFYVDLSENAGALVRVYRYYIKDLDALIKFKVKCNLMNGLNI